MRKLNNLSKYQRQIAYSTIVAIGMSATSMVYAGVNCLPTTPADTFTCNSGTTANNFANEINNANNRSLTLNDSNATISTTGNYFNNIGLGLRQNGSGNITIEVDKFDSINTATEWARGILGESKLGDVSIVLDSGAGTIGTARGSSVVAKSTDGNASITMKGGALNTVTAGNNSIKNKNGLNSSADNGNATTSMSGGTITTTSTADRTIHDIQAIMKNANAHTASATLIDGKITIVNPSSRGVIARVSSGTDSNANATMNKGEIIVNAKKQ